MSKFKKNDIPLPAHMQGVPTDTAPQVPQAQQIQQTPQAQQIPQGACATPTNDIGATVLMDSEATALMDSEATILMDNQAAAPMQDNATALMQEVSYTPAPAAPIRTENEYIPASVCGNDIINVKPLNATGGTSNLFRAHKKDLM